MTYSLAAALHWAVTWWAVATLVALLAVGVAVALLRRRAPTDVTRPSAAEAATDAAPSRADLQPRPMVVAALAAVVVVVSVVGVLLEQDHGGDGWWPFAWVLLFALSAGGAILAWRWSTVPGSGADDLSRPVSTFGHLLAMLVSVGTGVFSLFLVRYNPDDVYYVNRAVWVAQHGRIPLRDTMFGNGTFPSPPGEKVPVASIEALQGAIARVFGVSAPAVVYLVTTALASALAVWMLWRLVREWAPAHRATAAFVLACVFLAWDGWAPRTIGNFHFTRLWQGKSVFVALVVPAIYVFLTRWLRRRRRSDAVMLFALGACGVGMTSSGVFLVPMIAVVGGLACLILRRRAFLGPALLALYPIGAGVVILASEHGEGATAKFLAAPVVFTTIAIGTGIFGLVGWLAIAAAPWLTRDVTARAVAVSSAVFFVVSLAPGVHAALARLSGAGPVIWRVAWVLPLPALVGLLAAVPLPDSLRIPAVAWVLPAVLVGVALVLSGRPLWDRGNHVTFHSHPVWKVRSAPLADAQAIARLGRISGPVLAPAA